MGNLLTVRSCFVAALVAVAQFPCVSHAWQAQSDRPNVIIMMADDMGWADVTYAVRLGENAVGADVIYQGTGNWDMPNLDLMSSNGLTFSRMYSQSPVCSPTRASVMTGRAPQRQSIPFANTGKMQNREVTLGEYAGSLGYTTGIFGKWHLGSMTRDFNDANRGGTGSFPVYSVPQNNGFDVGYATESKVSTHNPGTSGLTTTTRYWRGPRDFVPLTSPEMQGDDSTIVARETNEFITDAVNNNEPFVALAWFHTPHKPTNDVSGNVNNFAAYRFAMENLDTAIGQIRNHVQNLGIADDTILIFTSDNGPEDGQDYNFEGLRNNKRELHEGGVRVPGIIEWPNSIAQGTTHTPMVTTDYLPTLLDIWGINPVDDRPLDGISMTETLFVDRNVIRDQTIAFKSTNGHQSVIGVDGRYKLISTNEGSTWSLYDLVGDFSESNALTDTNSLGSASAQVQALYNQLLDDYNLWEFSVNLSAQSGFTGDYDSPVDMNLSTALIQQEPPEFLRAGDVATGNSPRLYLERQHATLRTDLVANSTGAEGTYSIADSAMISKGTVVNSFLLHFNPTGSTQVNATPRITFDEPIIGVVGGHTPLVASDYLSFANPNFEPTTNRRMDTADGWTITDGGHTIEFDLRATNFVDNARILTRSPLNGLPVIEDSLAVTLGNLNSGTLVELANSDNADLSISRDTVAVQARTEFVLTTGTDIQSPGQIEITLEGSVFARTTVNQIIELYNYDTDLWEQVDQRNASRFVDATATVVLTTPSLGRFVQDTTGMVEVRVRYESAVQRQVFTSNTDQLTVTINP